MLRVAQAALLGPGHSLLHSPSIKPIFRLSSPGTWGCRRGLGMGPSLPRFKSTWQFVSPRPLLALFPHCHETTSSPALALHQNFLRL